MFIAFSRFASFILSVDTLCPFASFNPYLFIKLVIVALEHPSLSAMSLAYNPWFI